MKAAVLAAVQAIVAHGEDYAYSRDISRRLPDLDPIAVYQALQELVAEGKLERRCRNYRPPP